MPRKKKELDIKKQPKIIYVRGATNKNAFDLCKKVYPELCMPEAFENGTTLEKMRSGFSFAFKLDSGFEFEIKLDEDDDGMVKLAVRTDNPKRACCEICAVNSLSYSSFVLACEDIDRFRGD
jgi:hypothetical protein